MRRSAAKRDDQPDAPPAAGQAERLRAALTMLAAERGYNTVKVGEIAARAGVSRATFYELYTDKEQCFLDAHHELREHAQRQIQHAANAGTNGPLATLITAVTELASTSPSPWATLTQEALLAGPALSASRQELLRELLSAANLRMRDDASPQPAALLGGVVRLLGIYARRGAPQPPPLSAQLVTWAGCYPTEPPAPRTGKRRTRPDRDQTHAGISVSPRTLPRGRHRLPPETVEDIQRERIAYACADALRTHTVSSLTVSDIVSAAGVSREVFYAHYASKRAALLATQQMILGRVMSVTASAYFATDQTWPQRVHGASIAYFRAFRANPAFAQFALDTAYATGEDGARRADEAVLSFGLLLESGRRQRADAEELPPAICDAVAAAIAELIARHDPALQPPLRDISALALIPFIGSEQHARLLARQPVRS